MLLVACAFLLLEQRRDIAAGALVAVAVVFKPPWLLLLPYLLWTRRWRAAAALGIVLLVEIALPALRYGVGGTVGLYSAMSVRLAASTARLLTHPANVSLPGALAKLTGAAFPAVAVAPLVLLGLPLVAFGLRACGDRGRGAEDLAVLAPLAVLLSPQAWDYTVLTTLPALLLAFTVTRSGPWAVRAVTAALSVVVALDYVVLFGRGTLYAALMRGSPNTWFLPWVLGLALWARSGVRPLRSRVVRAG